MVGDTAGLIHPLCGNGMAMAIHGAKIASELIADYFTNHTSRELLEKNYRKAWRKEFASRLRTGRFLGKLLQMQKLSEILLGIFTQVPALLPMIIKRTHGKLLTNPQQ